MKNYINQLLKNSRKESTLTFHKNDDLGVVDPADMQLIIKFDTRIHFLLRVIDIVCKYVWIIRLKDKKAVGIANAFQKI